MQTTADIAKARGLTMVLNKAMVVLNVQSYDITKEALQKLDAKIRIGEAASAAISGGLTKVRAG